MPRKKETELGKLIGSEDEQKQIEHVMHLRNALTKEPIDLILRFNQITEKVDISIIGARDVSFDVANKILDEAKMVLVRSQVVAEAQAAAEQAQAAEAAEADQEDTPE